MTTVAGNVSLPHTTYNTVNGLAFMGRSEVLVAAGEAAPLERPYRDASEIHGDSGLGAFSFENPVDYGPVETGGVEFLYEKLMESEEKITILALAPLTNIAKLFLKHPDCKEKIDKIVFMGGSIFSGNPTPVATFNVWVDPRSGAYRYERRRSILYVSAGYDERSLLNRRRAGSHRNHRQSGGGHGLHHVQLLLEPGEKECKRTQTF